MSQANLEDVSVETIEIVPCKRVREARRIIQIDSLLRKKK